MFVLKFDLESAYALSPDCETDHNWNSWIPECLDALVSITTVLERNDAPATFFILGKVLERACKEIPDLLGNPLFDIQSHTYSHMDIVRDDDAVLDQLALELRQTSDILYRCFGTRPIGFCSPGGFYRGLRGHPKQLSVLWEQGYRYICTDGIGPPGRPMPAPFSQPYWYGAEGFPDLLEIPVTGWHCNLLFNTGHQSDHWQPAPGFPDGAVIEKLPRTLDEGYNVRKKEFQYAIDHHLIYMPAMHPWSVYRFDPHAQHVEWLIQMARENHIPLSNCRQLYEMRARVGDGIQMQKPDNINS